MAYGKPVGSLVLQSEQSFNANGRAQLRLEGGLTRRKPHGKTPRKTARKTLSDTYTRGTHPIGGEQGPTAVEREAPRRDGATSNREGYMKEMASACVR